MKFKVSQFDSYKKKLVDSHKVTMKQETEKSQSELRDEWDKVSKAEKACDKVVQTAKLEKKKLLRET